MGRWIRLSRQEQSREMVPNRGEGFRLVITAEEANEMPTEVFLYRKRLVSPLDEEEGDEFLGVCSCIDLVEYPVNAPVENQPSAFFRKNSVDVVLPSQTLSLEVWAQILVDTRILVESLNKLDYLSAPHSIVISDEVSESESL